MIYLWFISHFGTLGRGGMGGGGGRPLKLDIFYHKITIITIDNLVQNLSSFYFPPRKVSNSCWKKKGKKIFQICKPCDKPRGGVPAAPCPSRIVHPRTPSRESCRKNYFPKTQSVEFLLWIILWKKCIIDFFFIIFNKRGTHWGEWGQGIDK